MKTLPLTTPSLLCLLFCLPWLLLSPLRGDEPAAQTGVEAAVESAVESGGEKEGIIHCANLIYGGVQTSRCFSDDFLSLVQEQTGIPIGRRFKAVKLDSPELFDFPFVMMTGEKKFVLSEKERTQLRKYLDKGGFLVASAGCSSKDWDASFKRELHALYEEEEEARLKPIEMKHAIWKTVYDIKKIELAKPQGEVKLAGLERNGKLVVVYSSEGLNDTAKVEGCCCCGGNEVKNAYEILVNIFVYSLLY